MAREKEKNKEEERSLILITTEGREVCVEYKIDPDIDDFVLTEIKEALQNNEIWCPEDWIDIKFGNGIISELDMKKIIGINWF